MLAATVALRRRALPAGALGLGAVLAYGVLRLIVDGFRADEAALLAGLRASQILAAVCAALAAWGLGEGARDYGGDATGRMKAE
jgi:prolipoprotein diacylglyceryltransferase